MEGGGAAAGDLKKVAVVEGDASPEAVGGDGGVVESSKAAAGARSTGVETSVIGSVAVGSVVAAMADVEADESSTGGWKADAGACSVACAEAASAVMVSADLVEEASSGVALKAVADLLGASASGDVYEVKGDMQM
jgi:hypothetical protein